MTLKSALLVLETLQNLAGKAYAAPMRPAPMMPTVFRCNSCPTKRVGSQPLYWSALMNLSPSTTLLAAENVSAAASSAVVSVRTPAKEQIRLENERVNYAFL